MFVAVCACVLFSIHVCCCMFLCLCFVLNPCLLHGAPCTPCSHQALCALHGAPCIPHRSSAQHTELLARYMELPAHHTALCTLHGAPCIPHRSSVQHIELLAHHTATRSFLHTTWSSLYTSELRRIMLDCNQQNTT